MNHSQLRFSKNHIWVQATDNRTVRLGLSDYAQSQLREIVFLNLPDVGDKITAGECFGDVEDLKNVTEMVSPVGGTVTEINASVQDNPGLIHDNPYESWLVAVRLEDGQLQDGDITDGLMEEADYLKYVG